jgi:hypothetical protein
MARKEVPERKYALPALSKRKTPITYQQMVGSPHAVSMPSYKEMPYVTAVDAKKHEERVLNAHIQRRGGVVVESSPTVGQVLTSLEEKKKTDEFMQKNGLLVAALNQIKTKLEDEEFHHKVELEERDNQIIDLKNRLEVLEARPIVPEVAYTVLPAIASEKNVKITKKKGYTIYRTTASSTKKPRAKKKK